MSADVLTTVSALALAAGTISMILALVWSYRQPRIGASSNEVSARIDLME